MSHHEFAPGQKTPSDLIARRRLGVPAARSSAPPHSEPAPLRYTPQHPLPTRRAGVANLISALIPDALIGSALARATMKARLADMSWLGLYALVVLVIDVIGAAVILSGGL